MTDYLGKNIRRARIKKNISQQELAFLLKVERSTVSGWETGKRTPDMNMLKRLSSVLDAPVQSLIAESEPKTEKPLVMLVDDEKAVLKYNVGILKQVLPNAETASFAKPSDAVKYARDHRIDLVLLDVRMGSVSGLDVCRELLAIRPETNVIYLTAHIEYAFDAWSTDASGFLKKPLTAEALLDRLAALRHPLKSLCASSQEEI